MSSDTKKVPAATLGSQKYNFFTSAEYYPTLRSRIDATKPGDRIVLATLWLRTDYSIIADIVDALCAASKRGANVTLVIDAFHFLINHDITPGPAYYFGPAMHGAPKWLLKRQLVVDRLLAAGIRCQIINQTARPLANPFRGRSHIKYSIINDEVFLGGCNLSETHFVDVMVSWHDKNITEQLWNLTENTIKTGHIATALDGQDQEIRIDATTTLLIDAGRVNQSIILDKAYELIDKATKDLLITYQYFPHGPVAKRLVTAVKRGVILQAFYNHPSKHKMPLKAIYGTVAWRERRKGPVEFSQNRLPKAHEYLHAKIITSERAALLSSHNYMINGVEWGTAEIGMLSTDPAFVQKLNETILRQLQ